LAQLVEKNSEVRRADRFRDAGSGAAGLGKGRAMAPRTRCHDDDWQLPATGLNGTEQSYRMAVTAIDNCKIEIGSAPTTDFKRFSDTAGNDDTADAFIQRLGHRLLEIAVRCEQKNKMCIHFSLSLGPDCVFTLLNQANSRSKRSPLLAKNQLFLALPRGPDGKKCGANHKSRREDPAKTARISLCRIMSLKMWRTQVQLVVTPGGGSPD
jgi:hypothetical protein